MVEPSIPLVDAASDVEPIHFAFRPVKSCARKIVPLSERVMTLMAVGFCTALFWFLALQSANIDGMNRTITQLSTEVQSVSNSNAWLNARVSVLVQPSRIIKIATTLHMREALPLSITE